MPIRISGLNSGLDTDAIVQELVSAYRTKQDKYKKAQTKLSWKQDAWKEMNAKIYNFYTKSLSNMRRVGNFNKKKTTVSDSTKATVTAGSGVANGTQTLKVEQLAKAGYLTGTELKTDSGAKLDTSSKLQDLGISGGTLSFTIDGETKSVEVNGNMTIGEFNKALKEQGISANFDTTQQRFFLSSAKSGEKNDFELEVKDQATLDMVNKLGLATKENFTDLGATVPTVPTEQGQKLLVAHKEPASNAKIVLNGTTFEGDSNNFSINGLNITALSVSGEMSITTATDVDGIYNMVKDFLKEYNEVVNAMEKGYNAAAAKGYEPLTDDEKAELSDKEVEKWEQKIKDSILRRDDTLRSVLSGMSTNMSKVFEVNGKKYSLSSFGIKTAGYFNTAENESYAYHIDNDPEDSVSSANEDKLRKMIEEDPDTVASFFTQLATTVYDDLHERMTANPTLSSSYKIYNDKQMQSEYDEYTKTIKKWEQKLKDMEDSYYKKFSAMETALAKLQSQTNSLSSLLGG